MTLPLALGALAVLAVLCAAGPIAHTIRWAWRTVS